MLIRKTVTLRKFYMVFLFILLIGFVSCGQSKDALHGSWELSVSKIFEVEEENFAALQWTFEPGGRFVQILEGPDGIIERTADWEYDRESGELHVLYDHSDNDVTWVVVELTRDTLAVEYTGYGFFVEQIFVRKQ